MLSKALFSGLSGRGLCENWLCLRGGLFIKWNLIGRNYIDGKKKIVRKEEIMCTGKQAGSNLLCKISAFNERNWGFKSKGQMEGRRQTVINELQN